MEKFLKIILICITLGVIANGSKIPSIHGSIGAVQVVENIDDYLAKNPDMKLVELQKVIPNNIYKLMRLNNEKEPIRYTLGVQHPTDERLAEGSNTYYYPTLQDVKLQLSYPENGIGGIITYLEILVDQDSDIGKAYVVAGSLGERYIRVLVEAKAVRYFSYKASFYGRNN